MAARTGRLHKRWYSLIAWLAILTLLLQPLVPVADTPTVYADDEFEPWCGSDCEDPDDDDDGNGHCDEDDTSCNNDCSAKAGSAINLFTGEETLTEVDLYLPGFFPLVIARTYRSQSPFNHRFGFGWDLNLNQRLQRQSNGDVVLNNGFCGRNVFEFETNRYKSPPGLFVTLTELANGTYELRAQDGSVQQFDRDGKLVTVKDRFDNQLRFAYHPGGRLPIIGTSRLFRSGRRGVVGYDYQLTSITDTAGRVIRLDYNADGRLSAISYGGNRQIEYHYDAHDNLSEVIDEAGYRTQYRYQDSRDANNLTAMVNHERQVVVERSYDSADRVVSETVDGHRAIVSYVTEAGRVKEATYTNGRGDRTSYRFDAQGNTTQVRSHSLSGSQNDVLTKLTYNNQNQMTSASVSAPSGRSDQTVSYTYDNDNRLTAATSSSGRQIETVYDPSSYLQPTQITNPIGGVSVFTYDGNKNVDTITTPRGKTYRFDWSALGLLTEVRNPLGHTTRYQYDVAGNPVLITDSLKIETKLDYDALGQFSGIEDALGNGPHFSYDKAGRLTAITDSLSNTYRLLYDSSGNLTTYTDPNSHSVLMAYSAAGNLISMTNALSQTTIFDYDGADNLIRKTDGNKSVTNYGYDERRQLTNVHYADGATHTYKYNRLADLVEANTSHLQLAYDYNNGLPGQPSQVKYRGQLGIPVDTTMTYDYLMPGAKVSQGKRWRSGLIYGVLVHNANQSTLSVRYEYDVAGNLTTLTSNGPANYDYTFAYDDANRLIHMGSIASSTDVSTTITYDPANRITGWTNSAPDIRKVFQNFEYNYDLVGNLTVVTDSVKGAITRYSYDAAYQLEQARLADGTNLRYTYDPAGNRTSLSTNNITITYQYDAANQLLSTSARNGTTYTYDSNGNLHTRKDNRGTVTYTWNSHNELVRIGYPDSTFTTYEYDALGRRSSRTDRSGKTTYYVYDGENLAQEIDQTGSVKAVYVHSQILDHPFSMTRGGVTYYYLYDRLGSVVGLTDAAGKLVAEYIYDPWGNIVGGFDGGIENPFRFTGREWDAETGLYYFRARYYDPDVGRFISRDPIGVMGGWNLYTYAFNNPVNLVDPSGKIVPAIALALCLGGGCETLAAAATAAVVWTAATIGAVIAGKALGDLIVEMSGPEDKTDPKAAPIPNVGDPGSCEPPDPGNRKLTDNIKKIAKKFGRSEREIKDAIHKTKESLPKSGPTRNPDVEVDLETGEVYPKIPGERGLGDSIGNIFDFLP